MSEKLSVVEFFRYLFSKKTQQQVIDRKDVAEEIMQRAEATITRLEINDYTPRSLTLLTNTKLHELQANKTPEQSASPKSDRLNDSRNITSEGLTKFEGARMRAFFQEMVGLLQGKSAELLSFEDIRVRLRLQDESYKGLQDVPVDRIVGSVGRYRDFTSNFLPKTKEMRERWSRVYAQANSLEGLPPIELYKVEDVYFVRDGNHRVSVARELGAKTIQAHVTELPIPIELKAGMTSKELDATVAYSTFLHHQSINLTEVSRYNDLMGHIYLHRKVLQQQRGGEVSVEEAGTDWYDNVYRPAITLIRKYNVAELIGNRTEGDLYLWMVDHLSEVKNEMGNQAGEHSFSDALATFLEENNLPVPKELKEGDSVLLTRAELQAMLARRAKRENQEGNRPYKPR